jgi:CheY-like chemotaxis protein
LSNAFKFTEKGGQVTLSISRPPANEHFRNKTLTTAKGVISFSVSDTGIGIPKDKQEVIFEAFQQADGSTKRKYGGTGLGLSISRELAFALGGEIHLESTEGKGSTFTLFLPQHFDPSLISSTKQVEIKEKEPVKKPEAVHSTRIDTYESADVIDDRSTIKEGDRVILIIEDEMAFANVLLDFVRERRYKGVIANQGNIGLSYARHYKPDAILLDLQLPIMDGTEVLKQIKNDPELRHIPVQIISSFDRKKEGLELGAFDFMQKPVTVATLQRSFDKIEGFSNKKLKRLLIVEDNEQHNNAIRELIGNGDVKCSSAYEGTEAYQMLTKESFDCVIVDLGLPDMSGFDLLEKIRAHDSLNKIPIIVYTGKDLKKEDNIRLTKLANTVVLKTADSHERLLDETTLFLHRVESRLPKEKQKLIRNLHKADEVLKNKKILIVDDDIRNIYSLTNALEDEELHCLTAENGKIALKTLKENPSIDLVLMDVMMPEMDGYEATIEIRKMNEFKKLPIIALTAKAMKGDREKCLAVGMSDYVSKPVNIDQLLSLMRVWLYR